MKRQASGTANRVSAEGADPFKLRSANDAFAVAAPQLHVYGKSHVCSTDSRGFPTPKGKNPAELVLDASEGFIPLWIQGVTLRWRFNDASMSYFQNPTAAKQGIRELLGEAILAWGDSAPVAFTETDDSSDFEIVMRNADDCRSGGCVLASAFFPDSGQHPLTIYPKMFTQNRTEQVETLTHEIGHVFGLRHFFAAVKEAGFPSVIFGKHDHFSIMNYGADSKLTKADKADLKTLYQKVWSGELKEINGTKIVLVKPFHDLANPS